MKHDLPCLRWRVRAALSAFVGAVVVSTAALVVAQEDPIFRDGVVAADHPAASAAGASILRQGGNVVDAAVATSFALSVVRPASCGVGGGGFMVIWNSENQSATALDYRERAPAAATPNMYLSTGSGEFTESGSVRGASAAGIPGTVAGLCYAAEKYGSLPLATLLQPAIQLCRDGVPVDQHDLDVQASALQKIKSHPGYESRFALLLRLYLNNGKPWKKGDRFFSPQRAILEMIAEQGAAAFYRGRFAEALVTAVAADGGIISLADLESRVAVERQVLRGTFHGHQIVTMPPPSSGGIALLQSLQSLEAWEQRSGKSLADLKHNSADYVHVVSEALKHAFADRAEFLGDTDFVQVPVERLLSPEYASQIAARIDVQKTLPPQAYGRFFAAADAGTSHFSVMDSHGNAVACTETINLTWGSYTVVPEFGVLLNNEMDDFSARPGEPNAFGLIQSAANAVEPGKKPLSSMTPTIIVRDGKAVFACGASGGPRIITATLQSLLNGLLFDMSPQQAVSAPRFHHQWSPNELLLERTLASELSAPLTQRGHQIVTSSSLAASQSAGRSPSGLQGGSDPRKHGTPAGQ